MRPRALDRLPAQPRVARRAALVLLALVSVARAAEPDPAVVVPPTPVDLPAIEVPAAAERDRAVVDVEVRLVLAVDGTVRSARLVAGGGEPYDQAVLEGVRRFRFTPALVGGRPVEVEVPYVHHFVRPTLARESSGPALEAVLTGIVQERGTRTRPVTTLLATAGELTFTASTDQNGQFSLSLPAGDVEIRVIDSDHKPFLQREHLRPGEELRVRYLVDRTDASPFEAVVTAARERTEVSRTTLSGRELTKVPGTFGDPFRVATVLPGVTTLMSLLPYPVVRGSAPGNTALLLDGVRLPLLFHLMGGPGVVHPELLDHVEFFPGGFPVEYGGATGGLVDGQTKRTPATEPRLDLDLSLTSADAFLRRTFENAGITATFAGRLGYPGLLLNALVPDASLSYGDYQARLDGHLGGGAWTAFVYGARDEVKLRGQGMTAEEEAVLTTVARFQFHHLDLRWRRGDDAFEQAWRVVFGVDETRMGTQSGTEARFAMPQVRWRIGLTPTVELRLGLEATARDVETVAQGPDAGATAARALGGEGPTYVAGAFAQGTWKAGDDLVLVGGLRADGYAEGDERRGSLDPRIALRYRLFGGDDAAWLKAAIGGFHQPPRFSLPVPGLDQASLKLGLIASQQASVGAELPLAGAWSLDAQAYFNRQDPVLFDVPVDNDFSTLTDPQPGVDPFAKLFVRRAGRAYGLELLLRRRAEGGVFGWLAYTLSRSERREASGPWLASDYDRTHVLNAVAGVELPRGWSLGARLLAQSGTPLPTALGAASGRSEPQVRLDLRIDRRFVWDAWMLDFYVDLINATVAPDSGGLIGSAPLRYVLPTLGVRAVL